MNMYDEQEEAIAGLALGIDKRVESAMCAESAGIPFGRPVMAYLGDDEKGYSPKEDTLSLTFSADLVTSNVVALVINGTTLSTVTFTTDHDTTMDAIVAVIEAAFPAATVTLSDDTNNRQITVYIKDTVMSGSGTVTSGDSQATITAALASAQLFRGVALHIHKEYAENAQYDQYDEMNVIKGGSVYVETAGAVNFGAPAYIDMDTGKFASSGYATGAKFKSTVSAAGLAVVEIAGGLYDGE